MIEAVLNRRNEKLPKLLRRLFDLPTDRKLLAQSGLGFLVSDRSIWEPGGTAVMERLQVLQKGWEQVIVSEDLDATQLSNRPLFGKHGASAVQLVDELQSWLTSMDTKEHPARRLRGAAIVCFNHEITCWRQLEGIQLGEFAAWSNDAQVVQCLCDGAQLAAEYCQVERRNHMVNARTADDIPGMRTSASLIATELEGAGPEACDVFVGQCVDVGLIGLTGGMRPREAIANVAFAQARGINIKELVLRKAFLLQLESRGGSRLSTISHLRCWDHFAVSTLSYNHRSTLPPRETAYMIACIMNFRNGDTC